jgi:hypothetical protein
MLRQLRDLVAVEKNPSERGLDQTKNQPPECRLATAAFPDQPEGLAMPNAD